MSDMVNQPSHYTSGAIETIDYIKDQLSEEEFRGYIKGQVLKYTSRAGKKGSEREDLSKAMWYLNYQLNGTKSINNDKGTTTPAYRPL